MRQYLMLFLTLSAPELCLSVEIPCEVRLEQGVQYLKIFWYKVADHDSLMGLVMKDLTKNITTLYKNVNHSYQVEDDLSLVFQLESREKKCETYRCSVWPPVGHSIRQSDYNFPQGCQKSAETMPEFTMQLMDKQRGPLSHIHVISVGVLFVVLVAAFILLNKQRQKHTKVPV